MSSFARVGEDTGLTHTGTAFIGQGDGFSQTSNTSQGLSLRVTSKPKGLSSDNHKPLQCRHPQAGEFPGASDQANGVVFPLMELFTVSASGLITSSGNPGQVYRVTWDHLLFLSPLALCFPYVRVTSPHWLIAVGVISPRPVCLDNLYCELVKCQMQY